MKTSSVVEPDISMFGNFEVFDNNSFQLLLSGTGSAAVSGSASVLSELDDTEAYLKKEERITSLAKERFRKELADITFSSVEEKLYSLDLGKCDTSHAYVGCIAKRVIRPILRDMESPYEEDKNFQLVLDLIDQERFHVKVADSNLSLRYISRGACRNEDEKMLVLTIHEDGEEPFSINGTKLSAHPKNRQNVLFKNGARVADIAYVLAYLIMLSMVGRELQRIAKLSDTEQEDDQTANTFKSMKAEIYAKFMTYLNHTLSNRKRYLMSSGVLLAPMEEPTCLEEIRFLNPRYERCSIAVKTFLQHIGCETVKTDAVQKMNDYIAAGYPSVMVDSSVEQYILSLLLFDNTVHYSDLLARNDETTVFPLPATYCVNGVNYDLCRLFHHLVYQKSWQVRSARYLRSLEKEYATSYQNKKNIPVKTLEAMKKSMFNEHFGFVEFDESVDLEKVEEVRKEFSAVWKTYLSFVDSTNTALRFRLLGNHKAIGLYYPHIKCLCVDVRNPHSFIHEYGHLIDYEYRNLSYKEQFVGIREMYKLHLERVMGDNSYVSTQLNGAGKYNIAYYLEPTEIFARSFELYLAKCKMVSNSLLPEEFSWAYPVDSAFLDAVGKYYDSLFERLSSEGPEGKRAQ